MESRDLTVRTGSRRGVFDITGECAAAFRRHGIKAGIHCPSGASARKRIEQGFDFVTIANDVRFLACTAKAEVAAAKGK